MIHNIAAFDGGGVNGQKSLRLAMAIEQRTGKPFKQLFDLIGGTSTGGLIVALMALDYSAKDISDIYERECKYIFNKKWYHIGFIGTRYRKKYFEELLKMYVGETLLGDLDTRIVIPTYRQSTDECIVFDSENPGHKHLKLFDVIRATSAAPTFFKPHEFGGEIYSDGGMIKNNPTLECYLLSQEEHGFKKEYNVISIGTSREEKPIYWKGGIAGWISKIAPMMLRGQAKALDDYTDRFCDGHNDFYWRLDPITSKSSGKIDDGSMKNMKNMIIDGDNSVDIFNSEINEICKKIK